MIVTKENKPMVDFLIREAIRARFQEMGHNLRIINIAYLPHINAFMPEVKFHEKEGKVTVDRNKFCEVPLGITIDMGLVMAKIGYLNARHWMIYDPINIDR